MKTPGGGADGRAGKIGRQGDGRPALGSAAVATIVRSQETTARGLRSRPLSGPFLPLSGPVGTLTGR